MRHLRLYAHVKYVGGDEFGALYDLHNGRVRRVPLVLKQLLEGFNRLPLTEMASEYFGNDRELFQRYVDFLVQGNWAFITPRPECFPTADISWSSAYTLSTAIVAHDFSSSGYDLPGLLRELSAVGCRHLELQLSGYPAEEDENGAWRRIGEALSDCEFRRATLVQTLGRGSKNASYAATERLTKNWPRFGTIVLLGQRENRNLEAHGRKYHLRRATTLAAYAENTWKLHPDTHFVGPSYFREALVANPYFNRRLAVDAAGNFKNDLLYGGPQTFGRVGERSVVELIADEEFRRRWQAGPDAIRETRDNPLRYCLRYDRELRVISAEANEWSFSAA